MNKITIEIKYEEGHGVEKLVRNPLKPKHLIWIPF